MKYIVDSSGWLEYFMNGQLAEPYAQYIQHLEKLVTPTIIIYEVCKKIKMELDEEMALIACSQMGKTEVVPLTDTIAYMAADISLEHKLAMADSIVYSTARLHQVPVITSDRDFKSLKDVVYIDPREPD